ncbi:MAG: VWA domain-containing protein [Hyphomicrobiales bacterium]|nr:VWA domain-containing protein [Hyphomicrobiales bacterium]
MGNTRHWVWATRFARDRTGSTAMIFAIGAVGLVGMVGLSLDYARMMRVKTSLQTSLDAAVVAAAAVKSSKTGDPMATLSEFFARNWNDKQAASTPSPLVIENSEETLRASATADVNMTFSRVLGFQTIPVAAVSEARSGLQKTEIALAVDNTGSMAGSKLDALKDAAKLMVSEVYSKPQADSRIKFGVVPFSEYVNVGTKYRGSPWLSVPNDSTSYQCWSETPEISRTNCRTMTGTGSNDGVPFTYTYEQCDVTYGAPVTKCGNIDSVWRGCVGSRDSPEDRDVVASAAKPVPGLMDVWCNSPLQRLTNDRTEIDARIEEFVASDETYVPAGMMWGWRVLSNTGPFGDGAPTTGAGRARKVLVLMTDGENTRSLNAPFHNGSSKANADALTKALCTSVKAANIEIYTVAFDVADSATRNMLRDCASAPGYFFDAKSSADLREAFGKIAAQISVVRLTK